MSAPAHEEWRTPLSEAAEWHLLSTLLSRPSGDWAARVGPLAGEVRDPALAQAARLSLDEADEGAYMTLLGPGGDVSPREAGHREVSDPGRVLAHLAGCYEAFAWTATGEEPPDHVATETAFVAYLKLKQAHALRAGDVRAAEVCAEATRMLLDHHLSTFAEPLARALEAAGASYLASAGAALAARVGPRPEPAEGGWVPSGLDGPGCPCPLEENES